MKLSVGETAKFTGVSVRTLHYYDEIGLLSPSEVTDVGYRYYNEGAILKLQQILFYRELDFSLKQIAEMMDSPHYDKRKAFQKQKELLILKRDRLDKLISLLDANSKGDYTMSFHEFDMDKIEKEKQKYANEVKERYGNTEVYAECINKTKGYSKEDWIRITQKMNQIFAEFSKLVGTSPDSDQAQKLVERWQDFITEHYYTCTNEILVGLGEMYIIDVRFKENINKNGEGTAEFMSQAIKIYCNK